jgi:hypothetical protein
MELFEENVKIRIDNYSLIDEKQPFELYALEIDTPYSTYNISKPYASFIQLQNKVTIFLKDLVSILVIFDS